MAEEQTSRILNKEIFVLVALAFATFWVFVFTKSMAAREQRMETRIAWLWYEQGKEYTSSGQIEKAIQSFRNATANARDNREYALALANALAAGHHNAEAQQLLLRLRESDPENAEINTYLARLTSQDRDISESVNYYQNALYGRWNGTQVDERRRQLRIELIHLLLNHQKHDSRNLRVAHSRSRFARYGPFASRNSDPVPRSRRSSTRAEAADGGSTPGRSQC